MNNEDAKAHAIAFVNLLSKKIKGRICQKNKTVINSREIPPKANKKTSELCG
jgi:hypothetical protein